MKRWLIAGLVILYAEADVQKIEKPNGDVYITINNNNTNTNTNNNNGYNTAPKNTTENWYLSLGEARASIDGLGMPYMTMGLDIVSNGKYNGSFGIGVESMSSVNDISDPYSFTTMNYRLLYTIAMPDDGFSLDLTLNHMDVDKYQMAFDNSPNGYTMSAIAHYGMNGVGVELNSLKLNTIGFGLSVYYRYYVGDASDFSMMGLKLIW